MGDVFPSDLGQNLNRLRIEAERKQADVAKHLKVDTSRVSRIETGDFSPTMEEVASFLHAVGSKSALDYLAFLQQEWYILDRPIFSHPDRNVLWDAEQTLQRLAAFANRPEMPRTLRGQAEMHEHALRESANYLADRSHTIAYIGDIGVGKTSFLCSQIGLLLPESDKSGLHSRMVLEVGGGGTTVCEVHVSQGVDYGIKVEPMEDAEVYRLATEFCEGLWARANGRTTMDQTSQEGEDTDQEVGVSREVERALRNMAVLNRVREKSADGKPYWVDPVPTLAKQFDNRDAFRAEVLQKLGLWNRMDREIWFKESSDNENLARLKVAFTQINNGRHPNFSLPERMHVIVKRPVLLNDHYTINVVDTKGVDKIAVRPDLQRFADDPRTITVLCSKFNSAPDLSLQGFLKHLLEIGLEQALKDRLALLVLPRADEALAMKDDSGVAVETADEGYLIKEDQVAMKLTSLSAAALPVYFSNIGADNPRDLSKALLTQVQNLRASQAQRIATIASAVDDLIANEAREHTQLALQEVTRRISVFAQNNEVIPGQTRRVYQTLLNTVNQANARTVWASTRRSGRWSHLNVYYYLGIGATSDVRRRADTLFTELNGILKNMRDDSELAPAYPFIEVLLSNVVGWRTAFLESVRHAGELSFRPTLEDDDKFWIRCEQLYGRGLPYRAQVAQALGEWFDQEKHQPLHTAFEGRVQKAWRHEVVDQLLRATQRDMESTVLVA